ncbi:hypothetical protein L1887_57618 [Cichorium endivia]|nr:hypothetical protein L1887_57618 [Cichorium endivia]
MSTTNMSTFLTASASKNRSRSFVDKENACVTRSKSRQSAAHQESLLALNSSNINKENETMIGAEDMSTTLNQTTLNQTTLNQTATLNQTTATSSQPANRTQMFTSASMDLTRCEAPSSGKTCVYSSPDDMELTEMAEASRTNVTSAAATTFRSEMSLTNLSSATAAYPNFSLANTASQSSQEIEQPNKTADLANFSQDTSIVQFPIRNPKLNHNFTGYSKLNQTFSSEMDLTNLGRTVDQSIVAAAAGATKSTCMFGDDDMELTDLEASKSNESSKNLSSLNEMNTTSNVIHYTSSSSSQEQTGSSSSGSKTLEQDSSVHFPVKNPELNNVSICKEPVVTVEVSAFGDQENVPASSNPESDKTAKSDKTVENSQTINMSTASIANATEAQRSSSKTQMFTSASMDLTRMTGSQETVQASSNCVKTQMFTSASMDLTRMTGTQETVQPSLNCVKTQMFTSASMDLTRITGAEEAVQQTEQTEENDQFTSEMELTNLERSNLERSNLETSNLERTNLNSSNRSESNEGRHTLASQNTRVYSQNDMDLTELKNDATRNPTMASRMELTELTSAVELNATAPFTGPIAEQSRRSVSQRRGRERFGC